MVIGLELIIILNVYLNSDKIYSNKETRLCKLVMQILTQKNYTPPMQLLTIEDRVKAQQLP